MPISKWTLASIILTHTHHNLVSAFQHHQPRAISKPAFYSRCASSLFAVVNIAEDAPRDIQTMEQWAYNFGVQKAGGLQFTAENPFETNDGSRLDISLMTSEDMPASTPILYVPNELILSSNKAIVEFGRQANAENFISDMNVGSELRHYYLMLKILAEWERGDQSPWYYWLNSLPRFYSNAASMTHFCYTCLPTLMSLYAMKERSNMNHLLFKDVPFLSDETKNNADLWAWAYQVVYTRSFDDVSGDLRIAPLGDYFNHGAATNIAMGYDEEGNFHVQTTTDVPAGSPLHMSYGCPSNPSFLFARYGFLDKSSPATFCKILISNPSDEITNLGYSFDRMLFYHDTGEVSQEVWDVLTYQYLDRLDLDQRREFYTAHMEGDYATKQSFLEKYYPEIKGKLLFHIDSFLEKLDQLQTRLIDLDTNDHPRAPLVLRHNEFVRETFLAVKARYYVESEAEGSEAKAEGVAL